MLTPTATVRRGIGLVELLVAIAVVGVLLALLLSAVQQVRQTAARADCQNRMRQLGLALHAHHDARGRLPGVVPVFHDPAVYSVPGTGQELNWSAKLLPCVDQQALWDATAAAAGATANPFLDPPHVGLATAVKTFVCPADGRVAGAVTGPGGRPVAVTSYLGVQGFGDGRVVRGAGKLSAPTRGAGVFVPGGTVFVAITDGLSNTLMLGERPPDPGFESGWWYVPNGRTKLPTQPAMWVTGFAHRDYGCGPNGVVEDPVTGVARRAHVFGPGRFNNPCDAYHFWSPHPGGGNFALADGSVRFFPYAARAVLRPLATRAGGETAVVP